MNQAIALGVMAAGHSVFLTGPAGSGKTYILRQYIQYARSQGKKVAVTASTGLAATHLGGSTIHAWAGIGIHDELKKHTVSDMSKSRKDQIVVADVLVIDEISMLHDYRLDMIDQICRRVREDENPFGGLQVVLCGDFFQLPPVNRAEGRAGDFAITSQAWRELDPVICYLDEQHRQDDDELLEILTALRANDLRRRHAEALLARKVVRTPFDAPVTELYTKNVNVDVVNATKLAAMSGDVYEYEMSHTGRAGAVESLKKSCLAPEVLQLKLGAFVMFVKNSLEKKYVNGTLGTVVGFESGTNYPIVETNDGRRVVAKPDTWEMRDGEKKIAGLVQIPLRLAWAITIHKSQGMTLDAAHMDLSDAFVPGMGYVALSRVRSLQSLSLQGINRTALMVNEQAAEIDEQLRRQSQIDTERYSQLEKVGATIQKGTAPQKKPKSNWNERIETMRQTHPNAFRPWKESDDVQLVVMYQQGVGTEALSRQFGRHQGSIEARLKKLLGEELPKSKP